MRTVAIIVIMNCHAQSDPVVSICFLGRFVVITFTSCQTFMPNWSKVYSCRARRFTYHKHIIFLVHACMHTCALGLSP